MKARKRTQRLRLLSKCLLACAFLGLLALGGKIWLYPDAGDSIKTQQVEQQENKDVKFGQDGDKDPEDVFVKRSNVYDRNLKELALSFLLASVYVKPLEIRKEEGAIQKLAELLDLDEKELMLSVASERGFFWLERNIDRDMVEKIKKLDISGVYIVREGVRFYPQGKHAAHVVGFSKGGQGLAGVESYYDNILAGDTKTESANMIAAGIPFETYAGDDSVSLIVTIDLRLQKYLEKKIAALVSVHDARSGMAMIMHSKTGEILALSNYPGYDSNLFWKYDSFERRNRIFTDPIQLGAFQHVMRMAAEMEQGNVPAYISEPEEIAEKIIEPKVLKIVVKEKLIRPVNPIWKELAKGVYWPVLERPFHFNLGAKALDEFSLSYGLNDDVLIDMPMSSMSEMAIGAMPEINLINADSTSTGLQALVTFNRLISEGKRVVPHVLKEIWLEKSGEKKGATFEQGVSKGSSTTDRKFIRLIHALSAEPQKGEVIFETIIEEKDDTEEQGLEFSQDQTQGKIPETDGIERQSVRCQDMVLGAIPSLDPEISMILIVDGMLADLSNSSYLKSTTSQILKKGLKIYHSEDSGGKPEMRLQEKELYEQWNKLHAKSDIEQVSTRREVQKMPAVVNLSFRKALQVLQNYNVRIRVTGSGRVVAQHPAPGTLLKEVRDCVLELKADN